MELPVKGLCPPERSPAHFCPPAPPACPPCRCNRKGEDQRAVWRDITHRIGEALRELEAVAPPNPDMVKGGEELHEAERRRRSEGALPEGRPGEVDVA